MRGIADLQIFTREGIQLTGKPLSEKEANELLLKVNGFSDEAKYSANTSLRSKTVTILAEK